MKIHFKNKSELEITQEVAELIKNRVIDGCPSMQFFSDKENLVLMVNLTEIVCITP